MRTIFAPAHAGAQRRSAQPIADYREATQVLFGTRQ